MERCILWGKTYLIPVWRGGGTLTIVHDLHSMVMVSTEIKVKNAIDLVEACTHVKTLSVLTKSYLYNYCFGFNSTNAYHAESYNLSLKTYHNG